jgi:hypothetical protein
LLLATGVDPRRIPGVEGWTALWRDRLVQHDPAQVVLAG